MLCCAAFYSCEKNLSVAPPIVEAPEKPSLNEIDIDVIDGVLSFRELEDFALALKAVSGLSRDEKDSWQESNQFTSLGSRYRYIQDQINLNPNTEGSNFISQDEQHLFYFDDANTLMTHAPDLLIAELLSPEGFVFIEGNLNAFNFAFHAIVKNEPSFEKMHQLIASESSSPLEGLYYFPKQPQREIVISNSGEISTREAKFFSCPFYNQGVWVWGHRKEEQINGQRQRLRVELSQAIYHFGGSDNRVFSYVGLTIENRKWSWPNWIGTFPDYEYGTLAWINGQPATSGETSAGSVVQSLRVDRRIQANLSNGSQRTLRFETNVVPDPTGWSFDNQRFGDSDEYYLIDNVISTTILPPNVSIVQSGGQYGFSRGKISVNWLNRSTTMDIQLGCQ